MAEPNPCSMWTDMFLTCQIERMRQMEEEKHRQTEKEGEEGGHAHREHADNCISNSYEAHELQLKINTGVVVRAWSFKVSRA